MGDFEAGAKARLRLPRRRHRPAPPRRDALDGRLGRRRHARAAARARRRPEPFGGETRRSPHEALIRRGKSLRILPMDMLSSVLTLPMSLAAAGAWRISCSRAASRRCCGRCRRWPPASRRPTPTNAMSGAAPSRRCCRWWSPCWLRPRAWIGAVMALATGSMGLGAAAWFGALALDLLRWERVAVSANNLWFQRGLRRACTRSPTRTSAT